MTESKKPGLPITSTASMSKAPPPISPVRWSPNLPRKPVSAKWDIWKLIPKCEVWKAVLLTLDLEPDYENYDIKGWLYKGDVPHGFPTALSDRIKVIQGNVDKNGPIRPQIAGDFTSPYMVVLLSEVARFAVSCGWSVPEQLGALVAPAVAITKHMGTAISAALTTPTTVGSGDLASAVEPVDTPELELLFDGVGCAALEKMFPNDGAGKWEKFAERAKRNGLKDSRLERGLFNPLMAAEWWLRSQKPKGWDMARCRRVLANNLPTRSAHLKQLLVEDKGL